MSLRSTYILFLTLRRRLTATVRGNLLQRLCQYPRDSTAHVKTLGDLDQQELQELQAVYTFWLCYARVVEGRTSNGLS